MTNEQLPERVSEIFDPQQWRPVEGFTDLQDITYHRGVQRDADGAVVKDLPWVRIAFDRPEVRNAFRPGTVDELYRTLDHARMSSAEYSSARKKISRANFWPTWRARSAEP